MVVYAGQLFLAIDPEEHRVLDNKEVIKYWRLYTHVYPG
jgi:hypothetical protein